MRVCRGLGCVGNGPEIAFTLHYGHSIRAARFAALRSGLECDAWSSVRATGFCLAAKR
jgi:hypothetical protein